MRRSIVSVLLCAAAAVALGVSSMCGAEEAEPMPSRESLRQAFNAGNFKDAYDGLRRVVLDPKAEPQTVGEDLALAVQALMRLNRVKETDALIEAAVAVHSKNRRLLQSAATQTMTALPHQGFMIAGRFERGGHRGGGQGVQCVERDRVRALQLMVQAMPAAKNDADRTDAAGFFYLTAEMLLNNRSWQESWRLQSLTDLTTLPDYEPGWGYQHQVRGAPVGDDGKPIFYAVPKTFEAAANDGERWRWCLMQTAEFDASRTNAVRLHFAQFLQSQFGAETLAEYGWVFGRMAVDDSKEDSSGVYALHTLSDTETIARTATGVRRFALPDEFNPIVIYRQVAEQTGAREALQASTQLATIYANRRQYPQAAEWWRKSLALSSQREYREPLQQIVGNWGRFEAGVTQPAGKGATIEYRFRNGKSVEFTAHAILVEKLLADLKAYIKSRPTQLDSEKMNLGDLGYRLVMKNQRQYLGNQVASWQLALEPRQKHFDRRITVTTPLQKAGAYLLRAKMEDGNEVFIILWLADTAIAKKPLDGKTLYFVADAVTGAPIPKANVEFFGYKLQPREGGRSYDVLLKQYAERTDADGRVIPDPADQPQDYQWIVTARDGDRRGRFAFLGFTNVWYGRHHDPQYDQTKVFTITDRPVYRPSQGVHWKFWVRHARYDQDDVSDFAEKDFTVQIQNPRGEKVFEKLLRSDAYGGVQGKFDLPADATLGVWNLVIQNLGGSSFRVEEYKKPEFEVTVEAPTEPVMLGQKIKATIRAKYYFGSPVTKAKVKYKVTRTASTEQWYPIGPWDWLYGRGYWWFAYDYAWYPGWKSWGCGRPAPFWFPMAHQPPEVVIDREVEIGPDGKVEVEIDTAFAKAVHPGQDHQYTVSAEVVDLSRRTTVGSGNVMVARKPFSVYAWVRRGYYRAGDVIEANFSARTLDGKPVKGSGKLTLSEIHYRDGKPEEKAVQDWELPTDDEGVAEIQIRAAKAGQYRLSYKVTDAKEHTIEGGYLLTVVGSGYESSDYRFSSVELIPDKKDYQPGDKVRLMINTQQPNSTVLLFVRPANGVYLPPTVLRLDGKTTVHEIDVVRKDMPNFFVEALTISQGQVYTEVKQLVVPPEKRILAVDVAPSATAYRPGQKAQVKLKLTDFAGKPFVGSTVVAIYDKSVEYISGGSNVPEIKEFFWKWRRHHQAQTETSLTRGSFSLVRQGAASMSDIGIFGATAVDDLDAMQVGQSQQMGFGGMMGGMGGGRGMAVRGVPMAAMADGAAAEAGVTVFSDRKSAAEPGMANAMMADKSGGGEPAAAAAQPTIRKQFADTAIWVGALTTAADGTAEVSLNMPENLTTWRIKVWGMGHGTKVGEGHCDVVTRKDLILRMQTPRFFVQKDEVVLSANVHNYLKSAKSVQVALEVDGKVLKNASEALQTVLIEPGKEARVDWRVRVLAEGDTVVRMKAIADEESDAMEMKLPAYVHGMLKMEARSGAIRPDDASGKMTFRVPAQRRPEQTRLEVRYSPTLAGAMVDALPYLVDYPYGCTEQTLNRFLPTVVVQKILLDMRVDLDAIRKNRTNLNAQEIGDASQRAAQWKRYDRNPVFDPEEVRRMVKDGVQRLTEMQLSDGGWGWFSGWAEQSTPHTTAGVVHGFQVALRNDVALVPGVLDRGVAWLENHQNQQVELIQAAKREPKPDRYKQFADNTDALVYMVLVDAGRKNAEMHEFLYRDRTHLSVYGMGLFGLAVEKLGDREKLDMILRNIGQFLVQDDENQTAWLNLGDNNAWWYWYGDETEAQAVYLKLLAKTDPKGETARRLVKYLLNNRKHATYWNSTRDTSLCLEAMSDFLRASGEERPEMTVEVWLDGKLQKAVEVTPATLFSFDGTLVVEGAALGDGEHVVELKKKGRGPLYFNGYLTNFTLEDAILKAGLEIKVDRKYYRLKKVDASTKAAGSRGQVVDQKVEKYQREPLADLASLKSGELVEIELVTASKNDYEYIVFEDMKPSGFEPVDLRSGYNGNALGAYMEFRDNRVVFFVRQLARGTHSVSYRMRAEIPGKFSAMPTKAAAMYAPELRANSDEIRLQVSD